MKTIEHHENIFKTYVSPYIKDSVAACLQLKVDHTFHVLANTKIILTECPLIPQEDVYVCLLSALYHDIGRFEQYTQYGTFVDVKSVNHATLGAKLLQKHQLLIDEPIKIQQKVITAVLLHNKPVLPKKLVSFMQRICSVLQDADKIDILRVLGFHLHQALPEKDSVVLHVKDEPDKYSEFIVDSILQKKSIQYTDLIYVNDFKLLLGNWVHELNYTISKKLVRDKKLLDPILCDLPKTDKIKECINNFHAAMKMAGDKE